MITTNIAQDMVTHVAVGDVDLSQISEAMRAWYEHEKFDPDVPVLWDLREAVLHPPQEDLKTWSQRNASLVNRLRPGRKTAWVLPHPEAARLAVDMLGAHDWAHKVRIFHNDMEAAVAWLTSTIR